MPTKTKPKPSAPAPLPYACIALVLQGGGALGAYQAGVFEGLAIDGIEPHWVAGISIGAINAALIAGNAPEKRVERLRDFWQTVTAPPFLPATPGPLQSGAAHGQPSMGLARTTLSWIEASRALFEGQRGFFTPRLPSPLFALESAPDALSHYDTAPLAATLERLVDFDRINAKRGMRLTVSAVNVHTGNYELFDNHRGAWAGRLSAKHILASGALPPGFAAVEIEGEYYWDGGLVSNTPLATVLEDEPRRDTLAFQVDLWSAVGPLPRNVLDVEERGKDIRFSSRTRAVTRQLQREQHLRRVLREVMAKLPSSAKKGDPWCHEAAALACDRRFNVVHLIYKEKEWDGLAKDFEFGAQSMRDHWASGLADINHTLVHREWLKPPEGRFASVTHDVHLHAKPRRS